MDVELYDRWKASLAMLKFGALLRENIRERGVELHEKLGALAEELNGTIFSDRSRL